MSVSSDWCEKVRLGLFHTMSVRNSGTGAAVLSLCGHDGATVQDSKFRLEANPILYFIKSANSVAFDEIRLSLRKSACVLSKVSTGV